MKKVIRLTESDLINVIKNIIKENDDYEDRSLYDPYYSDDEDLENQGDEGMMSDEDWDNWGKPTPDQGMMSDEDWDNWGKPTPDQDMEVSDDDVDTLPSHLKSVNESNFNFNQTDNRLLGDFFTVKNNFQYLTNKNGVEVYTLKRNGFSLVVGTRSSNDPSKVILMIQLRFPQGKSINYLSEVKGMSAVEVGVNDYGRMTELLQGAIDFGKAQSGYDNLPPLPR
jgi:hypothetical protein